MLNNKTIDNMSRAINIKSALPLLVISPVISVFLFLLPVKIGLEIFIACCFISFLTTVIFFRNQISWNGYKTVLLCYILFATFSEIFDIDGYRSSELRTLAYVSLFLLTVPTSSISFTLLKKLTIVANFAATLLSSYQFYILNAPRAHGYINAIPFATICATLSLFLFIFLLYEKNNKLQFTMAVLYTLSITTIIYTGTRGVWLAYMFGVALIVVFSKDKIKSFFSYKSICLTILCFCILATLTSPTIKQRYEDFTQNTTALTSNNYQTSVGARLQLWKAAIYTIQQDGLFGAKKPYQENLQELSTNGILAEEVYKGNFAHYHNNYLDKLVKYGIQGLVVWLFFAMFPLVTFFKYRRTNQLLFLLTLAPPAVYMTAALTDMPFRNLESLAFYITVIYLPYILSNKAEIVTPSKRLS